MPSLHFLPADVHNFDESHGKPSIRRQVQSSIRISISNEVDPWSQLKVLSLDGRGLRALAELHVLNMLMREIESHEQKSNASCSWDSPLMLPLGTGNGKNSYLPCHYFDYIGGASVGGLVAILLGSLHLSVEEAIQAVEKMASVGARPKRRGSLRNGFRKFSETRLLKRSTDTEKLMKPLAPYLSEREIIPGLRIQQSKSSVPDEYMCKSVILKYAPGADEFQESYGISTPQSLEIEEAARNTLSNVAPQKSSRAPGSKSTPARRISLVLCHEISKNIRQPTGYIGSHRTTAGAISSPQSSDSPDFFLLSIGPSDVHIILDDSEGVDDGISPTRIPEPPELAKLIPIDWNLGCSPRKLGKIREQTVSHCESKPIKELLRGCAKNLVDTRQQRAQTRRWERFAFGTHYNCRFCVNAGTKPEYHGDQYGLIEHLQRVHDAPPPDASYYDDYMEILKNFRTRA